MVPELSSSYKLATGAVVGKNSKVPIYILAEDRLMVIVDVQSLISKSLILFIMSVSSLKDSDDGEDGKQIPGKPIPSESGTNEQFQSFPVTSSRKV